MIEFEIKDGVKKLNEYLGKLDSKLGEFTIPLKQSGLIMIRSIDKNFREEGRPNKWAPLKPSTISARRQGKGKRKGTARILQDTGTLKGSITMRIDAESLAIGTSVPYAKTHQQGKKIEMKKAWGKPVKKPFTVVIPQRKFLLFQEEDKEAIEKVFSNHTKGAIGKGPIVFSD